MFPIPVADTINEIKARLSSLPGFDAGIVQYYITKHIMHHLNSIQCSEKLDMSDPTTRQWVEQISDLFYLVDDLCADVALLQKQSNVMFACKCNLTLLHQLKQIKKKVKHVMKASKKNVKTLPKLDLKEEGDHYYYYYKEIIKESCLSKEAGVVRAVATFTIMENEETRPAKHVCEDEEVKRDFDVVTWIDYDTLEENNHANLVVDCVNHDLEEKKKKKSAEGKEKEEGKGFLVVLDYFQNDLDSEEWLKLAEKLKKVAATSSSYGGGVLLVITTKLSVAQLVGSSFEPTLFRFDWLSPSETLPRSSFERITRTIESLLDVPEGVISVATKIVATLVRSRKLSSEADINLLKDEFLQEMWLEHFKEFKVSDWRLRQCFAYSLFIFSSYDYAKIKMLVRLWMAQGFLGHFSSKELEDVGQECIEALCNKRISIDYGDGDLGLYSTMRDLAKVVIGNNGGESWEKRKGVIDREGVLISPRLDVLKGIPKSIFQSNKNVSSFILEEDENRAQQAPNQAMLSWLSCDVIFSTFKKLRMLTLKGLGIKVLPDSIGDLKNLRYLDLSYNFLKKLPIFVGELRYLQTLVLSHCVDLTELPNDVNHFASLRHLEVDDCPDLMHMPSALKKLTWLRSLPHFVASSQNGVRELTNLNEIRGQLEISHLERFKFKISSRPGPVHTYLTQKQHLEGLSLRWNHDGKDKHSSKDNNQDLNMLQCLQPHPSLKHLLIIGYRGNIFSNWLSSLNNLVEISLYYCPKCASLPTLHLDKLQRLTLVSLDSLQFIMDEDSASPKLERVQISNCPNLWSWWKRGAHKTVFTAISELVVEYCPKLVSMPLFPKLDEKLVLDCSNMEPLLDTLRYNSAEQVPLSKLTHLTMVNLDKKQYPREEELMKNFTSLESLDIRNCERLKSIKGWKSLSSLDSLHISNCTDIDLPSEEWEGMKTVSELVIKDIPDLKSLLGIKHLPYMINLEIRNCPELTALPDDIDMELFSTILIEDCPELASLPESFKSMRGLEIINCPLLKD